MLNYSLIENHLTSVPNDFTAQTVNVRSFGVNEIVARMLERNLGLSKAQIEAVVNEYTREICRIVEEGNAISTPLLRTQPSIAGVFHGAVDAFDTRRHRIRTNMTAGVELRKSTDAIKAQKVQTADPLPYILEVQDILSGTVNDQITPGGVLQVRGGRLKVADKNPENGVYLVSDTITVKAEVLIENKPARLIVMLPNNLPSGTYNVEVRSTISGGNNKETKTLKTGRFNKELVTVHD